MKLMGAKRNFQVLLVPNYPAFRITVIYVIECRGIQISSVRKKSNGFQMGNTSSSLPSWRER